MDKEEFDFMEVKPCNRGWYYVTMFQFEKMLPEHPDYIQDWLEFDGNDWIYGGYKNYCYVCFIHRGRIMEKIVTHTLYIANCRSCPHCSNNAQEHDDPFTSSPRYLYWYCNYDTKTRENVKIINEYNIAENCPLEEAKWN